MQEQKTSEAYESLYHYTTSPGLLEILRTNTLWATHYKSLNDSSEITFARSALISRIVPRMREQYEKVVEQWPRVGQRIKQEGGLARVIQHDTEVFIDAHYRATGNEIYIVSFCGPHKDPYVNENGLLSQWRGYGNGGGFAIVFNTRRLEEMLGEEARRFEYAQMHLSDVVYNDDEDRLERELSEDISTIARSVADFFQAVTSGRLSEGRETCLLANFEPFFRCITRLKHRAFSEENEIRLAALRTVRGQKSSERGASDDITLKREKEVKARNRNTQVIPYIELFNSANMKLPIERIIVGPHREKEVRAEALRVMLGSTGIEIVCSDIPFV